MTHSFLRAVSVRASDAFPAESPAAVPCGELLCQRDSFAKALSTVVVSCSPKASTAPPAKPKKKGAALPAEEKLWDVVLRDTVLFPEGGGQPSDSGSVGGVACLRVENVDGVATHVLSAPLEPGAVVQVGLDWERREDHMCQHSAQHLLTALALRAWGAETTSWSLGESTSFVELGAEVSAEMMGELEEAANEAIKAATKVVPSWHSVADVNGGNVPGLRKSSKALPASVSGPVRVITFEGIDTNTCCGTHVHSTSWLQALKLLRAERAKGGTRVHYVAGGRVLSALGSAYGKASALASRLSVPQEGLLDRYDEAARKAAETERAARALAAEVVSLLAEGLRARLEAGERLLHVHRAAADADFVKALAAALDEPLAARRGLLLVTIGEGEAEGAFTIAGLAEVVQACSAPIALALEGRGGGKGTRYQGKCQRLGGTADALAAAATALQP